MTIVQFLRQKPRRPAQLDLPRAQLVELAHNLSMSLLTSTAALATAHTAEDLAAAIAEFHKHVREAQTGWGGLVEVTRHWRQSVLAG